MINDTTIIKDIPNFTILRSLFPRLRLCLKFSVFRSLYSTSERIHKVEARKSLLLPHFHKLWEKLIGPSHLPHTEPLCPDRRPLPKRNSDLRSSSSDSLAGSSYGPNNHTQIHFPTHTPTHHNATLFSQPCKLLVQ